MDELQRILIAKNGEDLSDYKSKLNVTSEEKKNHRREDLGSHLWYTVQSRRITGSKCGKILCQTKRTESLLKDILHVYPKNMHPKKLPAPIKWGIDNEHSAWESYTSLTRKNGHEKLTTSLCDFIIYPTMGWLGASPDAFIIYPSSDLPNDIASSSGPFTKKDLPPLDAAQDPSFYCTFPNG